VHMFFWLPVATGAETIPDVTVQAEELAKVVSSSHKLAEAADEGDGGRGRRKMVSKEIGNYHDGWISVLAWSHGVSHGGRTRRGGQSLQDISLTKYQDTNSPALYIMVMRGEVIPHALLRIISEPKNEKVKVTEYSLFNVTVTSLSTGGSGGESRLTENMSVDFTSFKLRMCDIDLTTGDITKESSGFWDNVAKEGVRDGVQSVPQLKSTLRAYICEHTELFHPKELIALYRADLIPAEELGISPMAGVVPPKGRRFVVSKFSNNTTDIRRFQEIFVKTITMAILVDTIAEKLKVPPAHVGHIYYVDSKERLIQLESDEQFSDLAEDASLIVEVKD